MCFPGNIFCKASRLDVKDGDTYVESYRSVTEKGDDAVELLPSSDQWERHVVEYVAELTLIGTGPTFIPESNFSAEPEGKTMISSNTENEPIRDASDVYEGKFVFGEQRLSPKSRHHESYMCM